MSKQAAKQRRLSALNAVHKQALQAKSMASNIIQQNQQRLDGEQQKLEQLASFQTDYLDNMRSTIKDGSMRPQSAAMSHQFLGQLQNLMTRQNQEIESYNKLVDQSKQQWLLANHKEKAIKDLVDAANSDLQQHRSVCDDVAAEQIAAELALFVQAGGRRS